MERRIEHGVTVINNKGYHGCVLNKLGCRGISIYGNNRFRVDISKGKKNPEKYLVGIFDTFQEACKAREIAERKRREGILKDWIASKPHGNAVACKEFWEREFENM